MDNLKLSDQYYKPHHDLTTSNYPFTVDEAVIMRSELLHKTMRAIWRFDFASPIQHKLKNGKDFKVLDVGCGSGTWILQLSDDYPLTKFVGLDKVPIYPKEFSQDNLQFIQGDIL